MALKIGDIPIGAVLVKDNNIIGRGYNRKYISKNPLDHAEILALKRGSKKIGDWRLNGTTLYSTMEPCIMCAGAILHYRVSRVVFGCLEPKFGGVISNDRIFDIDTLNHKVEYSYGILEDEIKFLMKSYFREIRAKKLFDQN
ncbi:MAG: nucleoside deaminase [Deferribacterales bacterium]